eukprot:3802099-Rhodomonas_salina.2
MKRMGEKLTQANGMISRLLPPASRGLSSCLTGFNTRVHSVPVVALIRPNGGNLPKRHSAHFFALFPNPHGDGDCS